MNDQLTFLKIRNRIRKVNQRLAKDNSIPRNSDRSLWAAFAIITFAAATGMGNDLESDPETVLADLLADLMHWCHLQTAKDRMFQSVDFESALERARHHYSLERDDERT